MDLRPRAINHLDVQLLHALHLKNTFGWTGGKEGHVGIGGTTREMNPIQTPLNVSKSKITDQPIRHSISNDDAKRPFRGQFQSVTEFKSADSHCTCLISSKSLETDKRLFQEDTGGAIRIGRVIRSSEAELSLRSRRNGICRQTDQPGL